MTRKINLRHILKASILTFLFLILFFISSCRIHSGDVPGDVNDSMPNEPEHIHYWYCEDVPASCAKQGYTINRCDCGEEYIDSYLDPIPHTFIEWEDVEPTCTEEGYMIKICECGYTEKDSFTTPLGHYYYYYEEVIEPTCDKEGYTIITCVCGESYTENYTSVAHKGEVYEAKAPTCTEIGWDSYTVCDTCGHTDYFEIGPLGHDYSNCEYISPTCFEDGYAKGNCARCNEWLDSVVKTSGHTLSDLVNTDYFCGDLPISYIYCTACDDVIYNFGHNYKASAIKATCTQAGGTKYTCSKCGDSYSVTRDPIGHISGEWIVVTESTCVTEGEEICRCMVCDEIVESRAIELKSHTFASTILETKIRYTCQVCGEIKTIDKESYNNSLGGSASGGGGSTTNGSKDIYIITFETNGGTNIAPLTVVKSEIVDLPIPQKENCVFCGWYLDSDFALPFIAEDMKESLTLYACWAENSLISSQGSSIITGVDENYTFTIQSNTILNDSNLCDYLTVKDRSNNNISVYIKSTQNNIYVIASNYYIAGETYTAKVAGGVSFADCEGEEIWFKINAPEYYDIVYRDDVVLISEADIFGTFVENGRHYLVSQRDMMSNGDVVVIYGDGEFDIIYSFKVVSEKTVQNIRVYEITDADPNSIFERYSANIVTNIDVSNIELSETLEEEVIESLKRSPLYAQFDYASILYAEQSAGNSKIKYKGIEIKEFYSAAKDESIIINFKAVAEFVRVGANGKEYGGFEVVLYIKNTLKFPSEVEFRDVDDFTFILGVDNTLNIEIYATGDKGLIDEYPNFKSVFDMVRAQGLFEKGEYDGFTIDSKDEPGEKSISVGRVSLPFIGFRMYMDLSVGFKFEATGTVGAQLMVHSCSQIGIQSSPGQDIRIINSHNTDVTVGVFVLGKIEVYAYAKMEVGVYFAGVAKLYVEAEFGPKAKFGGIFTAYTAIGDKGLNGVCGGYIKIGAEGSVKLVFELSLDVMVDELKIFEAELLSWKKSWWIVDTGETDIPMYFSVQDDKQHITINDCSKNKIRLDDFIDNFVVLQDMEEGTFKTEEKECYYYLVGSDTKKTGKIIEEDGEYYLQVDDFINTKTFEIRVVFDNVTKTVVFDVTLYHSVYMASVNSSACITGDIHYVRCSRCRDYFCGTEYDDYKWISNLPTASESGHQMVELTAEVVCPAYGGKNITYYSCTACEKLFYDVKGYNPISNTDEIEKITGEHLFENKVCACGALKDPPVEYDVTFDANGGVCATTTKIVTYNQPYGTLPTPTRENTDTHEYKFLGWYNENGELVKESTVVGAIGDHTLIAEWQEKEIPYFTYQIYVGFVDNSLIGSTGGIAGSGKHRTDSAFVISERLFTIETATDGYTMKTISWSINNTNEWQTVEAVDGSTTIPANTFSKGDVIYIECAYEQNSCVASNSLITLADGTQVRVDSLNGSEMLLVWNMETGKFDYAPIMFVDSDPESKYEIIRLYFSDGTDVKVISEHGFWDYDLNKYVYLDESAADYIGHTFAKQNGDSLEKVTLVDVVIETELTTAWSPVTVGHLCYFVNGMLSMPGGVGGLFNIFEVDPETMTYDYEQIAKDIETYGLFTYEELNAICPLTEEMFEAAGGAYLKISIGKGNLTMEELINMINRYSKYI